MVKKGLFFFIVIFCSNNLIGQNVHKAFSLLKERKYEQARKIFERCTTNERDVIPALYGLSLVRLDMTSPFFNTDTSYMDAKSCETRYSSCDKASKEKLNKEFQITGMRIAALKNNIAVDAFKRVNVQDERELQVFIQNFSEERVSNKARELLSEIHLNNNFSNDKPVDYYVRIIEKYATREVSMKAWKRLYELMTGDGELLSMERFGELFPDFPFDSIRRKDLALINFMKQNKCTEHINVVNEKKCREYIAKAAPKKTAYSVLQLLLKKDIDAHNWTKIKQELMDFEPFFRDNLAFSGLKATILRNDPPVERKSLGLPVNTITGNEYSPVISANGAHLYFCGTNREGNLGGEDIFVSSLTGGVWSKPECIPLISTKMGNEAPEALSIDETRMVLYYNGDIFSSTKTINGWSEMSAFKGINSSGWDGDAVLSADGTVIIFASEGWRKEGVQYPSKERKQGFDIYVSQKTRTGWSVPQNLGPTINTPWCDRYPYLHPDGKTLYFSSEGHGSLGGSDVYRSTRTSDSSWTEWTIPQNLGKFINTTGDDNGYKIETGGALAYFSVNNGKNIDIYTTEIPELVRPENVAVISGDVVDANGKPSMADVTVEDLTTGKEIGVFSTDPLTGKYIIVLPMRKNYGVYVSKEGFYPSSFNLDVTNENKKIDLTKDITIQRMKDMVDSEKSITIENVFFDTDKYELKATSRGELNRLIKILDINPRYSLVVEGHTDIEGSAQHNQTLSENRARSVLEYIVSHGIDQKRISSRGYGSTRPVTDNSSASAKQLNRRVEIRFTSK